jgi:hypothetical protein
MTVPPPELAAWISFVKDIATGCAAVIGAIVAIRGLSAWRKQLKGKTDYELARRLLKAVYKVRDAIRFVRRPAIRTGESAAAEKEVKIEDARLKENASAARDFAVYQIRWNRLADAISELEAEAFEAEISWGQPAREKLGDLLKDVATLRWTINQHIESMLDDDYRVKRKLSDVGDILYDNSEPDKPDAFTQRVQKTVTGLEDLLRPHLG